MGDMYELEGEAEKEHQAIAKLAHQKKFELVYLCGSLFKSALDMIPEAKFFETKSSLADHLKKNPLTDSTILVKASRGIGLETIVEHL
jgi:UDP-N-acetylmuramoyl-tripeptide--D-alanyl-D-alanine ligase